MKITDAVDKTLPRLQRFLNEHKDEVFTAIELNDAGIKRARHCVLPKDYKQDLGSLRLYGHPDALGAVASGIKTGVTKQTRKGRIA